MLNNYINKRGFTFIELLTVITIILTLLYMAKPNNFRKGETRFSRIKACYSNQRALKSAVEFYNLEVDKNNKMHSIDQELLIKKGYLKPLNYSTEKCKYLSVGDLAKDEGGIIYCEYHGDIEKKYKKPTPGSETE